MGVRSEEQGRGAVSGWVEQGVGGGGLEEQGVGGGHDSSDDSDMSPTNAMVRSPPPPRAQSRKIFSPKIAQGDRARGGGGERTMVRRNHGLGVSW